MFVFTLQGQNFVNNGASIFINSGANVVIGGDLTNLQANGIDGNINLDGNILLNGDFTNDASNNVFIHIEPIPNGSVVFKGGSPQHISGMTPVHFENTDFQNAPKELDLNQCHIFGVMRLDAILRLNSNRLILENGSPFAIDYVSDYILSETTPAQGYGIIQWNIGRNIGTYNVPFGSGLANTNDLNVTLSTVTPGWPVKGSVSFATYHTDPPNIPYPSGVLSLDSYNPDEMIDRFWYISPDFTEKPDIELGLKYTVLDMRDNSSISPILLKGIRYNSTQLTWEDMPPSGISDPDNLLVNIAGITHNDFYSEWTLVSHELEPHPLIPNSFTPNNDGKNDAFITAYLGFDPIHYHMDIYNRWGGKIYETDNQKKGWDGTYEGKPGTCPLGVYVYKIKATSPDGNEYKFTGRVNLIR